LDKFHSPKNVLNASMAELARVPGLGNMRAEKIKKILDTCASGSLLNNAQTRLVVNTNDDDLGSGDCGGEAVASNRG
jgi:DNA excision repair protein ERCC-4